MQTNLLWSGIEYYSLENCLIKESNAGSEINSTITGYYQSKIYTTSYQIKTNENWETYFLELNYRINGEENNIQLEKNSSKIGG